MIASVRGRVAALGRPRRGRGRGRRESACWCTRTPGTPRRPAAAASRGPARHVPGRARGLADALRLRRRRRAGRLRAVQTVSGVGPRLALAMLAVHAPDALRAAVAHRDLAALTKVPGIGRRAPQRHRARAARTSSVPGGAARRRVRRAPRRRAPPGAGRCATALVGLGWSAKRGRRRRRGRGPRRAATAADVAGAAARRAARAGPVSVTVDGTLTPTTRLRRHGARRRPAAGDDDERRSRRRCGRTAPRASSPARPACATSSASCSRRPGAAARRPTTCCCPGRPGSARPRWR